MSRRDALMLTIGALAYPAGIVAGHLIFHRSVIYPHNN